MNDSPSSKPWLDEEGLRLFSEWLGMNYGKKVFGDHMEHHAQRIFSHATRVIESRRAAHEPTVAPRKATENEPSTELRGELRLAQPPSARRLLGAAQVRVQHYEKALHDIAACVSGHDSIVCKDVADIVHDALQSDTPSEPPASTRCQHLNGTWRIGDAKACNECNQEIAKLALDLYDASREAQQATGHQAWCDLLLPITCNCGAVTKPASIIGQERGERIAKAVDEARAAGEPAVTTSEKEPSVDQDAAIGHGPRCSTTPTTVQPPRGAEADGSLVLHECDEYLNRSPAEAIHAGSILHQKMKQALRAAVPPTVSRPDGLITVHDIGSSLVLQFQTEAQAAAAALNLDRLPETKSVARSRATESDADSRVKRSSATDETSARSYRHGWTPARRIESTMFAFVKLERGLESCYVHEHSTHSADCDWVGNEIKCRTCGATVSEDASHD